MEKNNNIKIFTKLKQGCKFTKYTFYDIVENNMPKRTHQPKTRRRARKHGFRARMSTKAGQLVLKARRLKKRAKLSI